MSTDDNAKKMGRAAGDYVKAMDPFEIPAHFRDAAMNALENGDGGAASEIRAVISGPDSCGDHLRNSASILLNAEPELLKYFTSDFTRGFASRVT